MKIKNTDIELRLVNLDDLTNRYEILMKNIEFLRNWLEWTDFYKSIDDLVSFSNKCMDEEKEKIKFTYLIYYKNEFVGQIDLQNLNNEDNVVEIGYWLSKEFNNKGIMKACVNHITDYALEKLGKNEVIIKMETDNLPSKQVAINSNYEYIRTDKSYLLKRGEYYDIDVFSKKR